MEQMENFVGKNASFAGTRTGDDQFGAGAILHSGTLGGVQVVEIFV
jgi:hypothetical protein